MLLTRCALRRRHPPNWQNASSVQSEMHAKVTTSTMPSALSTRIKSVVNDYRPIEWKGMESATVTKVFATKIISTSRCLNHIFCAFQLHLYQNISKDGIRRLEERNFVKCNEPAINSYWWCEYVMYEIYFFWLDATFPLDLDRFYWLRTNGPLQAVLLKFANPVFFCFFNGGNFDTA